MTETERLRIAIEIGETMRFRTGRWSPNEALQMCLLVDILGVKNHCPDLDPLSARFAGADEDEAESILHSLRSGLPDE